MCLSMTLLPHPDGPRTTVVFPRGKSSVTPRRTGVRPKRFSSPMSRTGASLGAAATVAVRAASAASAGGASRSDPGAALFGSDGISVSSTP